MKHRMIKQRIAAALCAGLIFLTPLCAQAAEKTEIVYGVLRSDGTLDSVYVVNRFESETSETITDYGAYRRVDNLTDATPLELKSDGVRFTLPAGTFFYQGEPVGASLPWSFRVQYLLNGAAVAAEDLSGADGDLELQITIGQGDPQYQSYYEHYVLSMTVTLDGERCRSITADGATVANSGTDRLLSYTILPSPDKTYTIRTTVSDFAMADIQINGVPLGMDVDIDTSEFTDEISSLQWGISQLDHGSSEVAAGAAELQSGTSTLAEGTDSLVQGAQEFSSGLSSAKSGSAELAAASAQIVQSMDALSSGADRDMTIGQLRSACQRMLTALDLLEGQCDTLGSSFGGVTAAAESYVTSAQASADALNDLGFSDGDVALLNTLLGRTSLSADVTTYLSAEIAALRRVLSAASGIQEQLTALRAAAQDTLDKAAALSAQLSSLSSGLQGIQDELAQTRTTLQSILALLDTLEQAGASEDDGVLSSLSALIHDLNDGMQSLDAGLGQLQTSFALLQSGIESVDGGVDALAEGADTLLTGTNSLSRGAGQLDSRTSGMDTQIEETVNSALSSLTGGEEPTVSYMDERNDVALVQFVLRIPGVSEAEAPEEIVEEEAEESFWEKLRDLF